MEEAITVLQLNNRVKSLLTDRSVNDIWLICEISNLKRYPSGHYYFTLKDGGSEIRGVMFKSSRGRIDFEPEDNMKVTAFGRVDLYVERGSYQFVVETMRRSGIGDLYLAYEALKRKLEAEGLFDRSRKRPLPEYPRVIGVVTSPTGAVIHDIITTAGRLFPADILLAPAQVQGAGAAESIAAGIRLLNREKVDVMIVGRGGGSIEDLWAFNEEIVARAISESSVPVISAVGHETDFTIADLVADVRASTPTAAAEIALRDRAELIRHLDNSTSRLNLSLSKTTERMRSRFLVLDSKLSPKRAEERVSMQIMHLDELTSRLASSLRGRVDLMHRRLIVQDSRLEPAVLRAMSERRTGLDRCSDSLRSLDPHSVLGRGYSFITDGEGRAITSASRISVGSEIGIEMRDGRIRAEVRRTEMRG